MTDENIVAKVISLKMDNDFYSLFRKLSHNEDESTSNIMRRIIIKEINNPDNSLVYNSYLTDMIEQQELLIDVVEKIRKIIDDAPKETSNRRHSYYGTNYYVVYQKMVNRIKKILPVEKSNNDS